MTSKIIYKVDMEKKTILRAKCVHVILLALCGAVPTVPVPTVDLCRTRRLYTVHWLDIAAEGISAVRVFQPMYIFSGKARNMLAFDWERVWSADEDRWYL